MKSEETKMTIPLTTVEDLTETTDESFAKIIIPSIQQWIGEELWRLRYSWKETIRDHDKELGDPIARGE